MQVKRGIVRKQVTFVPCCCGQRWSLSRSHLAWRCLVSLQSNWLSEGRTPMDCLRYSASTSGNPAFESTLPIIVHKASLLQHQNQNAYQVPPVSTAGSSPPEALPCRLRWAGSASRLCGTRGRTPFSRCQWSCSEGETGSGCTPTSPCSPEKGRFQNGLIWKGVVKDEGAWFENSR